MKNSFKKWPVQSMDDSGHWLTSRFCPGLVTEEKKFCFIFVKYPLCASGTEWNWVKQQDLMFSSTKKRVQIAWYTICGVLSGFVMFVLGVSMYACPANPNVATYMTGKYFIISTICIEVSSIEKINMFLCWAFVVVRTKL